MVGYRKFHIQKLKKSDNKNSGIFHISAQRGGSNKYPQFMFSSKNKKNNVYPCKLQFYYVKVGVKGGGVKII